jgi:hypothetical protein
MGKTLTSEGYKRSGKRCSVKSDVRAEETKDPASGAASERQREERSCEWHGERVNEVSDPACGMAAYPSKASLLQATLR